MLLPYVHDLPKFAQKLTGMTNTGNWFRTALINCRLTYLLLIISSPCFFYKQKEVKYTPAKEQSPFVRYPLRPAYSISWNSMREIWHLHSSTFADPSLRYLVNSILNIQLHLIKSLLTQVKSPHSLALSAKFEQTHRQWPSYSLLGYSARSSSLSRCHQKLWTWVQILWQMRSELSEPQKHRQCLRQYDRRQSVLRALSLSCASGESSESPFPCWNHIG